MSFTSLLAKIEAAAVKDLKVVEADLGKLVAAVEPAAVSFLKTVSHDFLTTWMPTALQIITNLLASGQQLSTATLGAAASQLEATALKAGGQVLQQDALTTIQMAAAHIQAAAAALPKPAGA